MRKTLAAVTFALGATCALSGAEVQGVIADWNCVKPMVKNGRARTLKDNRNCSLMHNYRRSIYGVITDDRKFYRLDDPNNEHVIQLLQGTPDKDNLKVVVTGDIEGETIKVVNMSIL